MTDNRGYCDELADDLAAPVGERGCATVIALVLAALSGAVVGAGVTFLATRDWGIIL